MTLAEALAEARQRIPPAEVRLLLGQSLSRTSAWLEAHREEILSIEQLAQFRGLVARRAAGEPVAYLLGSLGFTFFVYVVVNYGMVSGLLPVVGVPLPMISFGGTAMVTLLAGFGIVMSIHGHRNFIR